MEGNDPYKGKSSRVHEAIKNKGMKYNDWISVSTEIKKILIRISMYVYIEIDDLNSLRISRIHT